MHRCRLPVEIVYNGPEEFDADTLAFFKKDFRDVTLTDLSGLALPTFHRTEGVLPLKGWLNKIYGLYISSFAEVLVMDSDNLALVDPTKLFEEPEYRASGNMHWPDFHHDVSMNAWAYEVFGFEAPWPHDPTFRTAESGQLMLNRVMHSDVLEWLWYLNAHSHIMYKFMYGDKDTFRIAFALAGKQGQFRQVTLAPRAALMEYRDVSPEDEVVTTFILAGEIQQGWGGSGNLFFHRVSPGAKFHLKTGQYLRVNWVTDHLTPTEAPFYYTRVVGIPGDVHWWPPGGVDTQAYQDACANNTFSSCVFPERHYADDLHRDHGHTLFPAMPVSYFPFDRLLRSSYDIFMAYRKQRLGEEAAALMPSYSYDAPCTRFSRKDRRPYQSRLSRKAGEKRSPRSGPRKPRGKRVSSGE
ncbi:hypothetical protein WJX72_000369 [[Myrmecia] bisecta]|uniref:Uncharacterized protein n=1 Tax=[Myrmecia] bisecta TaxID=41462 RepID=A0AAW1PAB5_9CHLO